jgi:anti-anti-sigma factor
VVNVTRRQSVVAILLLLAVVGVLAVIIGFLSGEPVRLDYISSDIGVAVGSIFLMYLYLRGYEQIRYVVIIVITLMAGLLMNEPYVTQTASLALFVPAVLAMILAEPIWVFGSSVTLLLILLVRGQFHGAYADPFTLLIFILTLGGMLAAHLVTRTTQKLAAENNARVQEQKNTLESQAAELGAANEKLQHQLAQQRQLLELVETLETPAVSIANDVLLAPVVGHVDQRRAQALSNNLLNQAAERHCRLVILDIAGVSAMDTAVIGLLMNIAQALRLLGCEVIMSGISAEVAIMLTQLNVSLPVRTVRSPHEALVAYSGVSQN